MSSSSSGGGGEGPPLPPHPPTATANGGVGGERRPHPHPQLFPQPNIREIHKNAYLKLRRDLDREKKGGPQWGQGEAWWVVFCVHDDVEAYLEFYESPKTAASHRPARALQLNKALHVTTSALVGAHEFAVTLPYCSGGVIRLEACDWEQMSEWVESLQAKLRDMKIVCPKDNLYSAPPELLPFAATTTPTTGATPTTTQKTTGNGCQSTRDPNSPLPPPPPQQPLPPVPPLPPPVPAHPRGEDREKVALALALASSSSGGDNANVYGHVFPEEGPPPPPPPLLNGRARGGPGRGGGHTPHTHEPEFDTHVAMVPLLLPPPPNLTTKHRGHHRGPVVELQQRSSSGAVVGLGVGVVVEDGVLMGVSIHQDTPLMGMIGMQSNGEYRIRREEATPTPQPPLPLPLKEAQVLRLEKEMRHSAGVRQVLRRRDLLGSIALVDFQGGVWVAGWKQASHPVLWFCFHVGDQLLSIGGAPVTTAQDAHAAIRNHTNPNYPQQSPLEYEPIEVVVRRLPLGQVFVLKRTREGEPLGLVAEGGSGEISEVLVGGLAWKEGLRGVGTTGTNWYLTEINHRPLSLFSKDNEVKERLGAVGREISILLQPSPFIKHLRKGLKVYKGHKEYVVG